MTFETNFAAYVDQFQAIVLSIKMVRASLRETCRLALLRIRLTDEYRMIKPVLETMPSVTLAYATQAFLVLKTPSIVRGSRQSAYCGSKASIA